MIELANERDGKADRKKIRSYRYGRDKGKEQNHLCMLPLMKLALIIIIIII
jgi:hypothetical protein